MDTQKEERELYKWYKREGSTLYYYYAPAFAADGENFVKGLEWCIYLGANSGFVDIVLTTHGKSIQVVVSSSIASYAEVPPLEAMKQDALDYAQTVLGPTITLPSKPEPTYQDIYLFLETPWLDQWHILDSLSLLEESEEEWLWEERVRAAFKRARERGCVDQLIAAIEER